MYDINKVAELTGLSKVTIYKKIKKVKELEPFIVRKDDKTYILEEGVKLIKEQLTVNSKVNSDIEAEVAIEGISTELSVNKELINLLTQQLHEKDRQLQEKDKQITELHKLIENSQVLLKEEQQKSEQQQVYLAEHFVEVDNKLKDLKEKMNDKRSNRKGLFSKFLK